MARTAILVVNGFDRGSRWGAYNAQEAEAYPWIELCLRQIARHSSGSEYEVRVYDNSRLASHRRIIRRFEGVRMFPLPARLGLLAPAGRALPWLGRRYEKEHAVALDALATGLADEVEYIITLDNDAFPLQDGWIEKLVAHLEAGAKLVGVYRDEMPEAIEPFVHISCLCVRRRDFVEFGASFQGGQDVGQELTSALRASGGRVVGLRRSNVNNLHFLMGGVYGRLIYHQGAGGRHAKFWRATDVERDEEVRKRLRDAAFADLEGLIEKLTGLRYDELGTSGIAPIVEV